MKAVYLLLILSLFSSLLPPSSYGGSWRDDFSGERLKSCWRRLGPVVKWEVKNGFLHARQESFLPDPKRLSSLEFLELTAFPGPHRQLTIIVTDMKRVGIGLGKSFPDLCPGPDCGFFYLFYPSSIVMTWTPRNPEVRLLATDRVKKIRLKFDSGGFQVKADGKEVEFEDPHFDVIDYVVFSITAQQSPWVEGWADSFEISGPSITEYKVEPKGKLATTWGEMRK